MSVKPPFCWRISPVGQLEGQLRRWGIGHWISPHLHCRRAAYRSSTCLENCLNLMTEFEQAKNFGEDARRPTVKGLDELLHHGPLQIPSGVADYLNHAVFPLNRLDILGFHPSPNGSAGYA